MKLNNIKHQKSEVNVNFTIGQDKKYNLSGDKIDYYIHPINYTNLNIKQYTKLSETSTPETPTPKTPTPKTPTPKTPTPKTPTPKTPTPKTKPKMFNHL